MTNKLPIPRLPHERRESNVRRVSRACDECRARKAKCDGTQPRCAQCATQGLHTCSYSDKKNVRLQKELDSAQRKSESYKELLQDLSAELEGPIADRIRRVLKQSPKGRIKKPQRESSNGSSSSSMGSLDGIDVASEDYNRDEKSRATGYMGKNSEVVWMQRLGIEAKRQSDDQDLEATSSLQDLSDDSLSSTNYHLDERKLKSPAVPNAFVLPPRSVSDELYQIYLDKVQPSLPLLRQDLFSAQYHRCFLGGVNPGGKWLAILNLIYAISSVFSRLSGKTASSAEEALYFARAKSLSTSDNILYQHDDLQQVQIEAFMAFYLLTISQINRAWKMIGIAARSGVSLGINLDKRHGGLDDNSEEARKQLWWSIFRLEHLLSVMTGRVSCIGLASSSLSPPLPVPSLAHTGFAQQTDYLTSGQLSQLRWTMQTNPKSAVTQVELLKSLHPSAALYHFYMVDLSLIAHEVSSSVYATDTYRTDWARIESRISICSTRIDSWLSRLNVAFHFQDKDGNSFSKIESSFQISLALSYYSTRIVLYRPCLNRPAFEKNTGLRLPRSRFSNLSALACLQASLAIARLLPDQTSLDWSYQLLEWWGFVHVLTQASVILLLDISIGPVPTKPGQTDVVTESAEDVLKAAKKIILWLQCLGTTSSSAQRSFEFANRCIHSLTAAKESDLSDLPGIPPMAHRAHTDQSTPKKEDFSPFDSGRPDIDDAKQKSKDFVPSEESDKENMNKNEATKDSPATIQPSIFSLYDCDVDMPDVPLENQDSEFQELLLSMMTS